MNSNPPPMADKVRRSPDEQVTETLAALRTYDALDVLTALSFRQKQEKQDRLATAETETMPRVRPPQGPAQRGPGSHRKPREIARRHQHRSPGRPPAGDPH